MSSGCSAVRQLQSKGSRCLHSLNIFIGAYRILQFRNHWVQIFGLSCKTIRLISMRCNNKFTILGKLGHRKDRAEQIHVYITLTICVYMFPLNWMWLFKYELIIERWFMKLIHIDIFLLMFHNHNSHVLCIMLLYMLHGTYTGDACSSLDCCCPQKENINS